MGNRYRVYIVLRALHGLYYENVDTIALHKRVARDIAAYRSETEKERRRDKSYY